jgi:DNA-binding Xre family transcriptional regulator
MIKVTVRQAAKKRGITSAYQLAQVLGEKNRMGASRLWKGELPRLQTLDRVAEALGDCELSELIARVPNKGRRTLRPPKREKKKRAGKKVARKLA